MKYEVDIKAKVDEAIDELKDDEHDPDLNDVEKARLKHLPDLDVDDFTFDISDALQDYLNEVIEDYVYHGLRSELDSRILKQSVKGGAK